ncbi:MAG TPA: FAD-dependent oxidoreductase [Rhabdochlamydiaceae bacterium]|nr:FAD-dependent oxidoreductase [Rhabdochlamydiaceae bacterium]
MKSIAKNLFFSFVLTSASFSHPLFAVEEKVETCPVAIIGGGIGALTSAIYVSRAGITPLVIEGHQPGGAITQSPNVQNWPGELEISGLDLVEKVHKQAEINGAQFSLDEVVDVDFSARPFTITLQDLYQKEKTQKIKAKSVIIALGTTPNFLGIPGETGENGYWTKGVYNCAVCDGGLFKNKVVAVIGGGDAAITEAHYLSNIAKTVHVFVRKDAFRGVEERRRNELFAKDNIDISFHTVVKEILGNGQKVTHLLIEDLADNKTYQIEVDGVFLAIGSKPNSSLFQDKLEMDNAGYLILKKDQQTSVEGVYAIGDIVDPIYKQAISAAGDAAKAALQAEKYLSSLNLAEKGNNLALQAKQREHRNKFLKQSTESTLKKHNVIEITSMDQFKNELRQGKPVLIDFYAKWCGPCRQISPLYSTWAENYSGKIKFLKVDVDSFPELASQYHVSSMPTMIILDKNGNLIDKKIGTKEITSYGNKLDKHYQGKDLH